jgi:hypothetical protein
MWCFFNQVPLLIREDHGRYTKAEQKCGHFQNKNKVVGPVGTVVEHATNNLKIGGFEFWEIEHTAEKRCQPAFEIPNLISLGPYAIKFSQ